MSFNLQLYPLLLFVFFLHSHLKLQTKKKKHLTPEKEQHPFFSPICSNSNRHTILRFDYK
ncbi:hypothetical protein ABFX02_07G078000 [Erythranthe guttata]